MVNWNRPLRRKGDGEKVKHAYRRDGSSQEYPYLVMFENYEEDTYTEDGRYWTAKHRGTHNDLENYGEPAVSLKGNFDKMADATRDMIADGYTKEITVSQEQNHTDEYVYVIRVKKVL